MMGVTPRRVRALIDKGELPAHKVGSRWVVDSLPSARRQRRPLSSRSRSHLERALRAWSLAGLDGQERIRTAKRLLELQTAANPASILLDWWGGTAEATDAFMRNLLERALRGDADGVRATLRRSHPAYLATLERLSDRVSTERLIKGYSREALADLAKVSVETLAAIEAGRPTTSPGPSRRVLRALDVSPTALPPMGAQS